jgi:putative hydroxymethylpyrimidine transport system substrate-binding protein
MGWFKLRVLRSVFAAVALAVGLAPGFEAGGARAAEPLTVLLDWFVNPDHAPLVVAGQLGFFKDAGLEVRLVAPADPNDPPKLVAAGQADVAITYQPQLHLQIAAGLPLVRIATLIDTPLNSLMVLADGPVRTLADLKGRRIGFSVSGFEDALLATMLGQAGLGLKDTTLINVNFALAPALLTGQVDAVIGAFRNVEFNQIALEGHPGRLFLPEESGVPAYDELILVTSQARLGDPRLPRFLGALERGALQVVNHPDESWAAFVAAEPSLDDALNRRAWAATVSRFAHSPAALDPGRYDRFAQYLKERGLIETVPPVASYAVAGR